MGHSGHLKAHHEALAERLNRGLIGFPKPEAGEARRGWQEILEILFDEEEARLAVHLPLLPAPLHDIAKRAHQSPEVTKALLDRMADKGLVMDLIHPKTGKTRYLLAPPVIGFFEFSLMRARDSIPKKELSLALSAYCHQDSAFAREAFRGDTVLGRAMVEESRLSPDLLPDVLPWERASELIADAQSLAVSLCYCRHKAQHAGTACDAPQDVCLSMNGGADFVIRRSFGRAIDRGEALAILQQCKEKELVQIADNVMEQPTYLCNCCGCCCGQLSAINEFGLDAVNKSGFIPEIDAHHCNGCGKCARACPIGAIDMKPIRQVGDRKNQLLATVSQDRCIGCGVCSRSCPERKGRRAMQMIRDSRPPYVPKNSIEKALRTALERNRLPHLLVDQGTSLGHLFLNRCLVALSQLPVVEQALASKQLQSRFVQFFLSKTSRSL